MNHYNATINRILNQGSPLFLPPLNTKTKQKKGITTKIAAIIWSSM